MMKSSPLFPLILLAAGRSRRMGMPKGLFPWNGRPWIVSQLEAFFDAGGTRVCVVLGHQSDAYRACLKPQCLEWSVDLVLNPDPDRGPFSSLQVGLKEWLRWGEEGVFVSPIDVPFGGGDVWRSLQSSFSRQRASVCVPQYGERGGHPILLSRECAARLMEISCSEPAARLDWQIVEESRRQDGAVVRLPVSEGWVTRNWNEPHDFSAIEPPHAGT